MSASLQALVELLQGEWGDDLGLTVQVSGETALFSDGTTPWNFKEDADGALSLRGARLIGSVHAPVWRFSTGVERRWARIEAAGACDAAWGELFLCCKEERLQLRRLLTAALAAHDFDEVARLRAAWEGGGEAAPGATAEQAATLAAGRWLVPGACFRHRKFDYRGVVLGCEASCSYPASWRAQWVPNRPEGELQPFYHCLVDERDRPGRQTRYVAQENMEAGPLVFPVQAELADLLLVRCDGLGGYLPGPRLEAALERQRLSGRFLL